MGLTLIEAAKYENRLEHLAVLKTFSEGELLARLPFMNIAGSGLFYSAEQELHSVGFRAVNVGYTQNYGVVDQRQTGGAPVWRRRRYGPPDRDEGALVAMAFAKQLPGNPMAFNNAGKASAGAPLNFDHLDELIDSVNAYGGSKVLVLSKAMRRQLNALARATIGGGVYQTSTNSYGMTVHRYQDCGILTIDRDAQGVEVMGYDEACCSGRLAVDPSASWWQSEPFALKAWSHLQARLTVTDIDGRVSQRLSERFYGMGKPSAATPQALYYAVTESSFQSLPQLQADVAQQSGQNAFSITAQVKDPGSFGDWWSSPTSSAIELLTVPFGAIQSAGPLKARYVLENEFGRTVSNFVVTVP